MPALSPHGHLVVGGHLDGQWIARERSAFSVAIAPPLPMLSSEPAYVEPIGYTHETYTLRKIAGSISVWALADWSSEDVARLLVSGYIAKAQIADDPPVMDAGGNFGVGPIMGDLAKVREFNNEQVAKLNEQVAKACAGPGVGCDG